MAGVADRTLALKLITDVGDIGKQTKVATNGFKKMGSAATKWGKAFGGAVVFSGLAAIPGLVSDAFKGFREGEQAAKNLGITWKNLGLDAGELAGAIDGISGMALDLGFDDAEVLGVFDALLGKTGDVDKAFAATQQVMDLVRGRGWSMGKALKYVTSHLGKVDTALDTNRGKAEAWAKDHPLQVTAGKIVDDFETIVGKIAGGDLEGATKAIEQFAGHVDELIFGKHVPVDIGKGITVDTTQGGLVQAFQSVGGKLAQGVVDGMAGLGAKLKTFFDTEVATVDWLGAIGGALSGVWTAIQADPSKAGDMALAGAAIAVALAVPLKLTGWVTDALSAVFKLPGLIVTEGVKGLLKAVGVAVSWGIRAGMVTLSIFEGAIRVLASGLKGSLAVGGPLRAVMLSVGASVAGGIVAGVVAAFSFQWVIDAIGDAIRGAARQAGLDNDLPLGPGDLPWMNRQMGGSAHGLTLVGEGGPELLKLPAGSHVYSNTQSRGMMGEGPQLITQNVVVNLNMGVGDPVAIGREVDRVLRVYRKRAGILSAGQMV
jgi:hypothetical protein